MAKINLSGQPETKPFMTWNAEQMEWSRTYRKSLHLFLQQGNEAGLASTATLGQQAAGLGLETLDMALFHEKVLIPIVAPITSPAYRNDLIQRATAFFMDVMVPVEQTHRGAIKTEQRIGRLTKLLKQRTKETNASARKLSKSRARRLAAEASLRNNKIRSVGELEQSERLQEKLRNETRALLSAQEAERRNVSLTLQNETAQTLCSILIQLLSLNTTVHNDGLNLEKDIDTTRQLIKESL